MEEQSKSRLASEAGSDAGGGGGEEVEALRRRLQAREQELKEKDEQLKERDERLSIMTQRSWRLAKMIFCKHDERNAFLR